jgi:hypothetical protein
MIVLGVVLFVFITHTPKEPTNPSCGAWLGSGTYDSYSSLAVPCSQGGVELHTSTVYPTICYMQNDPMQMVSKTPPTVSIRSPNAP